MITLRFYLTIVQCSSMHSLITEASYVTIESCLIRSGSMN